MSSSLIQVTHSFAANYDCAAYSAGTYNNSTCSTGASGGSTDSGGLANTGYDIIIPVALALSLLIAGAILLVKRLRRRAQ